MPELKYGEKEIVSLSDVEHVRKRPGTYIGSVENPNHLALEIIANSLDEAMNGFGDKIIATFSNNKKTLEIEDFGRGIVVDGKREEDDKSTLEAAFSVLNTGGKYDTAAFSNSLGANGQGSKITNFLSTNMRVETYRDYNYEKIDFKQGEVVDRKLGTNKRKKSGVVVKFSPDPEIFDTNQFDINSFKKIVKQMSFLTKGVRFIVVDKDTDEREEFYSENGLKDFIGELVNKKEIIKEQLYINRTDGERSLEVALTYTNAYSENVRVFANNGENPEGGTHISSFRSALTRQLNNYAREHNILKEGESNLSGNDYSEGLVLILNLKAPNLVYDGQTKTKVNSTDIRPFVAEIANEEIRAWLESNPRDARTIIEKALESRRASEAARKAREKIRKPGQRKKGLKAKLETMGKLHDASNKTKPEDRELFIVEGERNRPYLFFH